MLLFILYCALDLKFDFTTGTFLTKGSTEELRIFYEIPENQLTYIKSDSTFSAKYEILCSLTRKDKEIGDTWVEEIPRDSSKKQITGELKIPTPPGKYALKLIVKDLNSKKISEKKSTIFVENFKKSALAFSSRHLTQDRTLSFEVYNFCRLPFKVFYKIEDSTKTNKNYTKGMPAPTGSDSIVIDSINFINKISIKLDSLKFGSPVISLVLCTTTTCDFVVDTLRFNEPFWIKSWETKVKQLYYIADKKEIDSLIKTPVTDREKKWSDFWRKKSLIYNDDYVETEYFKRVDYANSNFTHVRQGWESDRGRIYILLGEPDEIETHPFEVGQNPYEVWYYYSKKVRHPKFVFEDKAGFGDYILVYPIILDIKFQLYK